MDQKAFRFIVRIEVRIEAAKAVKTANYLRRKNTIDCLEYFVQTDKLRNTYLPTLS